MGVELSQNRDVSSEGKSGSSNRASPTHSSFMSPACLQPGSYLWGLRMNVTILTPSLMLHLKPQKCDGVFMCKYIRHQKKAVGEENGGK